MGTRVNVRFVKKEDVAAVHRILTNPEVIWGTLQLPSGRVWGLGGIADGNEDSFSVVAEIAEGPDRGKVVGNAGMRRGTGRTRHVAGLGMCVDPAYHGQGIGSALLEACLETARRWWNPVRIELEVYPDNERALRLYRKFGFEPEGCRKEAVIRQGRYVDVLVMSIISPEAAGETGTESVRPAKGRSASEGTPPDPDREKIRGAVTLGEVRPPGPGDVPGIRRLYENPSVLRNSPFLPWDVPAPQKIEEELGKVFDRHVLVWADGEFIAGEVCLVPGRFRTARTGTLSLRCLTPDDADFAGLVARELLKAAIDLGDNWLGLHRLEIETHGDEVWLFRVLEEMGFRTEARRRKASLRDGKFEDRIVWGRLCSSW